LVATVRASIRIIDRVVLIVVIVDSVSVDVVVIALGVVVLALRVWSPAVPVQGSPRLIILYEPPQLVLSVWTPRLLLFPLLFLFLSPPPTLLIFLSFFQRRVDQDEKYKYDP